MNYSYKKTFGKMLKYGLTFFIAALPFMFALIPPETKEMSLLDLAGYLVPVLKTVTLGAVIVGVLNFVKIRLAVK